MTKKMPNKSKNSTGVNRRAKTKYPNLNPKNHIKRRQSFIDYDYVSKLSDKDKEFLSKFTNEYYCASFDTENSENNIHDIYEKSGRVRDRKKKKEEMNWKQTLEQDNNIRNLDTYALKSCVQGLEYWEETKLDDLREKDTYVDKNLFEDAIIDVIDKKIKS